VCGCGGKGGWINPPEFVFHADCCLHDKLYELGGTEADRKAADRAFLADMLDSADRHGDNVGLRGLDRWSYRIAAYVYYRAVRWCGKRFFHYRSTP
jgi:hypothetical protein